MANRPGLTTMPLSIVEGVLNRERRDRRDLYAALRPPQVEPEIGDSLAPAPEQRYRLLTRLNGERIPLRFTPTSFRQLCAVAGVPLPFFDKAPAALGLGALRCMLEMSDAADGRQFLLRLRMGERPTLRAVLPQSFVRLDDEDVYRALAHAADGKDHIRVASLSVDEDTWFTRIVTGTPLNLGSSARPDPVVPGFDIITSETGVRPLEMRHVLLRVVCSNGATIAAEQQGALRRRQTGVDRPSLEARVRTALDRAFDSGVSMAQRMSKARADFVKEPREEIARIFRAYRLGNPAGRIGAWVAAEVLKGATLFGTSRWTLCQAFTAVARGLEHTQRIRFEDAMGDYLMQPAAAGQSRPRPAGDGR